MSLVLGEVRGLILSYGGMTVLLKKVSQEDSILRVAFPGRYPQYERKVKRLLPWIW